MEAVKLVELVRNECSTCADVLPDLQEAFGHKRGHRLELRISLRKADFSLTGRLNRKHDQLLFRKCNHTQDTCVLLVA